ncbi:MAG: hypothetical protein J1E81_06020 [Eubacterium sp.]|nr:hypothetical protein [Eubacterium sp.]
MKGCKGIFKHYNGNLVLSGFDTEHDLHLAEKALERMLNSMACESIYAINKVLEPYRRKAAKAMDYELSDEVEND